MASGDSRDKRHDCATWHPAHARRLRLLCAFVVFLLTRGVASADVLTASWDRNPEPDVTGYILSWGLTAGGPYTNTLDVGNVITTPVTVAAGFRYFFVVKAYNSGGLVSDPSSEVSIDLTTTNHAPTINSVSNQTSAEGATVSLQLVGSDVDGNPLTFSATGLPPGLSVSSSTGLITGSLGFTASGSYSVTATVSDGLLSASTSFTWTVTNTNRPPTLNSVSNQTSAEGSTPSLQLVGSDPDGTALTYSATGLPPGLNVNSSSGLISGSLGFTSSGSYSVTATVSDGTASANRSFTWTVTNTNRPPTINSVSNQTSAEGGTASLQLAGSDPDGDSVTFSATGLPPGLSANSTGLISGSLGFAASGSYSVTATVSDGVASANTTFTWSVTNTNRAPVLANPTANQVADSAGYARGVLGDTPIAFWRMGEASGTTVADHAGTNNGTLAGAFTLGQTGPIADGNNAISFNGADATHLTAPASATIGAINGSTAITMETWINPQTATPPSQYGLFYSFPGQAASYLGTTTRNGSLQVMAALVINGVQQWFVGGPTLNVGSWYHVAATYDGSALRLFVNGAAAGQLTSLSGSANIGFNGVMIGGSPIGGFSFNGKVDESALYDHVLTPTQIASHYALRGSSVVSLQLSATDPDSDSLTYSASGLPTGLSIDPATGVISGTITSASVGTWPVTATATDGALSSTQTFNWTVANTNQAPVLSNPSNLVGDSGGYARGVLADTPASYWRMGETSGTSVADHAGTSTGTLAGGFTLGQSGPIADGNGAIRFNGLDASHVTAPATAAIGAINGSTAVTIEGWINPQTSSPPSHYGIFYSFPGQGASYLATTDNSGSLKVMVALMINGVQRWFVGGPTLSVGSWYHVAATYDGSALRLFVNGVAAGQLTGLSGALNIGSAGVMLGGSTIGGFSFNGVVDEAAIYSQVLTPTQIANHYALRTSTAVALQLSATDPDGNPLTYSASGLPTGLSINSSTGAITGTLTSGSVGTYSVTVTASDGSLSSSQTFSWTVVSTNLPPVLSTPGNIVTSSEAYAQGVMADAPLGYWRLGEASGTSVADSTGASAGAVNGAATLGRPGAFADNTAMAFTGADGTNVTTSATALAALDGSSAISLEAWINPQTATPPTGFGIFYSFPGQVASYLGTTTSTGSLRVIVALMINGVQQWFVGGPTLAVGAWYHVAATYDGSVIRLFVNGADAGQLTGLSGPVSVGTAGARFGGTPIGGGYGFNGLVDEPAIYNATLTPSQVFAHYALRTYARATLSDTPVGYWRLDEASGTSVSDTTGTSIGTLQGTITLAQAGALADGDSAMRFNGVDGTRVFVPNTTSLAALNGSSAVTMEAWVNPQTATPASHFGIFYSFPGQPASYLATNDSTGSLKAMVALMINGVQRSFAAGPALAAGSWYHVAATYDGSTLKLYVNGSLAGQLSGLSGTVSLGTGGLLVGGTTIAGGYSFDGRVDEPAIYNYVLAPGQIASHYALRTLVASKSVAIRLNASDPNGDVISYSASGLPGDLSVNSTTGVISGSLTPASLGTFSVTVSASDGAATASQTTNWTITYP